MDDSNKKINVKDRIKKKMPESEWFRNVGKSIGYTTMDLITDIMPNTSDAISWNKDNMTTALDLVSDIRKNNGVRNMFNKQIKNLPQVKLLEQIKQNAIADLKSGNFYNKDRTPGGSFGEDGEFSFDDDLFGDVNVQFIDDDETTDYNSDSSTNDNGSRPPIAVINTMPLAKAVQSSTEVTIETMSAIAGQQLAVENEKIMLNQQSVSSILSGLNSINDNLALLVEFNADSTAKFHGAAIKYYEQSIEMMTNQDKETKRKKVKETLDLFTSKGSIKLEEYLKHVKQNLVDIKDENAMLGQAVDTIMNPMVLEGLASSPGMIIPEILKGFIPKYIKSTLGDLDKNLSSLGPAILAKIGSFENSDSPFLQMINKVFGFNPKISKDIDLGDYEKGAIQWDGESKKALVEVIPSYLRRIESALTGEEERIFNYKKGKFDTRDNIKKSYDETVKDAETSGYSDFKFQAKELARKFELSEKSMAEFEEDLLGYLSTMTNKGKMIRPGTRKGADGLEFNEFVDHNIAGGDPDRQKFLEKIILSMDKKTLTEAWTAGIRDSVANVNRAYDERRGDSTYASLYNDTDKEGKLRYSPDKLKGGMRDAFGLTNLDYLRDIRSLLIKGIRVFPDNRKKFKDGKEDPSRDFALKEKYEEQKRVETENKMKEEANKKIKQYSTHGKSIEDSTYMSDVAWLSTVGVEEFIYDENSKTGKAMKKVKKLSDKVGDKVFEILMGDEDYIEQLIKKYDNRFGNGKPVIQNIKEMFSDTSKAVMSYFTGQPYTTSDGVQVEGNENAIFGKITKFFTGTMDKLKGKEDGEDGVIGKFISDISEGFNKFKTSLFGDKALSEQDTEKTHTNIMKLIKERLPKAVGYGYGSAVIKTLFASKMGILGNFLLPGGGLSAALIGTAYGFLKQSETYNRFMFGELDENGERKGGLISKAWQDKYKEHASTIKKGAGIGIVGSLLLPGGPVLGGLVGIGASFAAKNEAFQEFLFGKDFKTDEKKSMMNGAFGRVFKKFTGDSDPKLAKFLGTAGLGVGIAQGVGLLPSFLLPGGPIMGSLLGLAGGIAASSDKFQEFLLGEKDVDGQRYGGLLHKVTNWFDITFARPLAIKMTEINDKIYGFMRKKVFDPIARSFEPMVYAVKNVAIDIKNGIVDAFSKVTNPIVEAFKDYVIKPVSKILKKTIVDPIKWMLKKTFGLIGKSILGVLSAPLGIINFLGKSADKYNAHAEVRHEQRNRRRAYDKTHKDGTWNYWDRKAAGKMTKEEKQELINEKLKYRDGKTWGQRKKEQKKDYKDEMARRKEKRDAMIKQYEEDKKFAKENGFKYRSKKQKEQREQQLREKEAWIQEQQLMQAQETSEKVSNISDNVIQLTDYQDKTSSKLDTITNTVKEGFNKLADKLGFETNNKPVTEQEEDHMSKIYEFLDNEASKDESVTLKEALDGLKGEFKELADHLKESDKVDNSTPAGVKPSDIVNISDSDMAKIYKYLDNKVQEDENVTLRGALDNLPEDFKPLFKNKKSITLDSGDNRIINLNEVRKKLRKDDQSHADGLDKVPKDGYLAELHKGEMVVPEKPAGKLRGLMDKAGKGFKGLTDVLSDVSEDDVDNREENKSSEKEPKGLMSAIGGLFGGLTTLIGNMTATERRDREDNALQLSDMEADRLKELEDLERRKSVMRKGVDFVQSKIAERKKAKDEQNWRDRLINAIKGVGHNVADAGLNLFDMIKNGISGLMDGFGNFGSILSSLAVPLGVAGLINLGDNYTKSEEYVQGHTDADGTLVSDDYHIQKYRTLFSARDSIFVKPAKALKKKLIDPTVEASKKIYNSKLGQKVLQPIGSKIKNSKLGQAVTSKFGKKTAGTADNVIDFAAAKAARGGDDLAKGAVKGTGKVVSLAEAKLAKEAVESGSGKAVAKAIGEGVEGAASKGGLIQKLITVGKEAVETLAKKAMEKFPKAAKLGTKLLQFVEPAFKALLKNADSILARFAKKITAVFAKIGLGASTAFIADAVFAVGDLVTGFTAGNAGNLFGVSTENVDARMRIISSLIQAVFNFNFMSIISLINEITNMMFNFNFLRQLAIGIYNLTGGKQEFGMRITSKQIDACKSIDEAVALMGLTPEEISMLKDGNDWVDFSTVENKDLGGVISSAEQMELARLQYNLANGTKLSSQAWVDKESKTFGSKVMDGIKKVFTKESAQQKLSKYQNKATTKSAKAAEHREKAANSNNIFSKSWNNSMAWLNEKSAKRAEKKAAKVAAKAPKKKEKAERKVAYYTEKAANAGTLTKWYYNWRKNANEKKAARYTLSADGSQVIQEASIDGSTGSEVTEGAIDKAMTPETFKMLYGTLAEGKTMTDGYGNVYDHNGNVIQDGDGNYYDSQGNLLEDGAGMGYGDRQDYYIQAHRDTTTKTKNTGIFSKMAKAGLATIPGGAAILSAKGLADKLFGKNKKAEDYTMVPIMDAEGNIVSYQSQLIDDVSEVEGFNTTNVIDTKKTKNQQIIPQVDEKGNVMSYTTVDKNKAKTGLFGRITSTISNLFGFGGSSSSNSIDNSSSVTNNTGDTYTTNNEVDTTPFGPLTEAINSLVNYDPTDNVDEEGNIKTGGILSAITNPVGFVTKKLANYGIDAYELTTGKEVAPEDVNKAVTIFNMLSNPLGYLYSKTRDYMSTPDEEGKTRWDKTKDWTSDKWNTAKTFFGNNLETSKKILGKTWNTVTEPVKKYANWVGGEFKEFGDNPWAYTLNSAADLNRNIYSGAKDKITKVKDFTTDKIGKAKGWVNDKFGDQISTAKNAVGNFMSDKFGFVTEGVDSDNSLGYNIGRVVGNIYQEVDKKREEIIDNVKETFNNALEKLGKAFTWLRDEFPKKIQEGLKWLTDIIWVEIPKKIGEGVDWAVGKIEDGVNWVKTELPKKVGELKDKFIEGFQKMWKTVTDSVTEKVNDMKQTFSKENISKVFTEKVEDIKKAWGNFTSSFTDVFDDIKKHIKLPDISLSLSDMKSFIGDLFKGFNDGGSSGAGASGPDSTSYVKPIKHTFSSTELLKPMNSSSSTNNVSNTNNNKFVFYSQSDERWSKDALGNRTMKDAGCGPTSLAMAISQLTGEQITPDTVAKLGKEHLPGYSQFSLFPSVADKLNMNYDEGYDNNFIVKNLRKGIPVVLSGRTNATGTPYTAEGHVVTASHMSGNNVFIQDPRGEGYSRYYPLTSVLTGLNKGMIVTPSSTTNVAKLSGGSISDINLDNQLYKQSMGTLGDHGEYISLNEDSGKAGASQVTVADRVLSYARAFLANTSKFSYSQPQRHKIDNNGNKADCSSFVSHVLTVAGDAGKVAGTSQTFWDSIGSKVDNPQIGDVVCQKGHVGLYSGDGNYIHMSGRKHGIKESKAIQKGNNAHRGYKRVLKNPSALVDPTIQGGNSLLGTVVATSSGNPVNGGGSTGGTNVDGTVSTSQGSVPQYELLGPFAEMNKIANNMVASIFNGKEVDLYAVPETPVGSNDGSTGGSTGGSVDISGETDTAKAVYKFLTGKGYTPAAACGILGNMEQESGVNPKSIQGGGKGPAAGICQWENYNKKSARWKGLSDYASSKGKDWTDLQSQLEWLDMELQGKDSTTLSLLKKKVGGYEQFKALTDVDKATLVFEESFERAGKPNMSRRYSAAKTYYSKFASAGAGDEEGAGYGFTMATSAEAAPSSGTPTSMNGWAYYDQGDSKWQEDISGKKIGPSGCGMASHAMMLTTMFGKQVTPVTVGKWARKAGYWGDGGMAWTMPNAIASKLGLTVTKSNTNGGGLGESDLSNIKSQIKSGYPVILSGKGKKGDSSSPFTSGGHIVLAVGVDGSGNLIINDPRGASYTKAYTDNGVLNSGTGLRGYWAFDKPSSATLPSDWATGDFTSTTPSGGSTTGGGTTTVSAPQFELLGPFAEMNKIGTNLVASIFNGKEVDMFATAAPTVDTSTGGSTGTPTSGSTGSVTIDESLMLSGTEGFFKALSPAATSTYNQYKNIFPSTILAQAALESAWGKSKVATSDKNLFGIKWTGKHNPLITVEKGRNCPGGEQGGARPYNRYKSFGDSVLDHGWFLNNNGSRYNATLNAKTPSEQITALGKSGYAESGSYGSKLQSMVNKYDLTKYNPSGGAGNGEGDGKTYMVSPKASYNKSINTGINKTDVNRERELEAITKKVNVAVNNINAADPISYTEILKLIMQELQAINSNTAATASGVNNIEIISANTSVSDAYSNTPNNKNKANASRNTKQYAPNISTGYQNARNIAGYKK